ncbi:MAG: hypothetical protein M3081_15665 [Gemmatimonadota bacterium]|nr:hypothetical protein [Gemmatimonadota bacterium]
MPTQLRPRSATEIIDVAVQIIRQRFAQLVAISLIAYAPLVVAAAVFGASIALLMPKLAAKDGTGTGTVVGLVITGFVIGLSFMVGMTVANAAITVIVSEAYLGREPSAGAALRQALSRAGSLIAVLLVQMLAGFIAFAASMPFLLLGPLWLIGVMVLLLIAYAWTFAMPAVVILEGRRAVASFDRSYKLVQGHMRRVAGILAVTTVLVWIMSIVTLVLVQMLASLLHVAALGLIGSFAQLLFFPMVGVVVTLLYYDLRIRKEGFDLEMMASELGAATGTVPASEIHLDAATSTSLPS